MNLKNYTSTVEASKSMQHIEDVLVEIGASNVSKKYEDKMCTGITFLYQDPVHKQTLAFHLKANVQIVFNLLYSKVGRPTADTKKRLMAQANRTAWKVLSDWTDIQCTMIMMEQAKPLQMFLPYLYDMKNGETFYDKLENGKIDTSRLLIN